jgi:hypothetical protein
MVVSVTDILDKLGNKITAEDRQQLLIALLSPRREKVLPGDLITTDLVNQVLADVADLQVQVASLAAAGTTRPQAPVLLSRNPTGNVEVGGLLTLSGANFLAVSNMNTVMLGGIPINDFLSADSAHLGFQVPDLFTGLPRDVMVFVTNANGTSASLPVRVLPRPVIQGGQLVIFDQTQPLGTIVVGGTYPLKWLIDSQTLLPVTYSWDLVFANLDGASESMWRAVNPASQLTPAGPASIARGSPLAINASVTVPSLATSADISLHVVSDDKAFEKSSSVQTFVVGRSAVVSDPRVLVTMLDIPPFDPLDGVTPNGAQANSITVAGGNTLDGVQIKFNETGWISIDIYVTDDASAVGHYDYSAEIENRGSLWSVPTVVDAASTQTRKSHYQVTVTVQNTNAAQGSDVTFLVVKAAHKPPGALTVDFTSFIRFPIQGANF